MQHLEEGTIHAWLDGALTGDEQARVEQHVQQCAECAAMVAEARGMIAGAARVVAALDVVPGGVIPKQRTAAPASGSLWRSLRLTPFRAALAASLMIAAASLITVQHDTAKPFEMSRTDSAAARTPSVAMSPAAPPSATPAAPPPAAADAQVPTATKPQAPTAANAQASAATNQVGGIGRSRAKTEVPVAMQRVSGIVTDAASKRADSAASLPPVSLRDMVAPVAAPPTAALATTEARRIAQDAPRDSLVINAAKARAGAAVREPVSQRMEAARALVMTSAPSMDAAGCYQVARDSSAALGALPERFVLERSPATTPLRNVIYAIDTAGRVDATVVGTWRDVGGNLVMVDLTAANIRQSLTLSKTVAGFMVQPVSSFAPNRPLRIARTDCPR